MATMMPSDIGEFETEGERTFYKFLEGVAKPDAHYLCWYWGNSVNHWSLGHQGNHWSLGNWVTKSFRARIKSKVVARP